MATLIIGLFIIITSAKITEFLGADEVRAIDEQLNLQGDIFTIIEIVPSMKFSYKIFYPIWNTSIYSSGVWGLCILTK